ncbi:hypothetical protein [Candidatus Tisiphia endosymbiont of Parasteatoda lunata]|uniref:hypothetical protein n=1 Tax=Candidatus Tisiphia endosymbiont of Parasteatoda lunata TaxID=3066275 RepID=UPI00313CA291
MSEEANIINHEGSSHGNNSWLASDKRSKEDEKYLARWKYFTKAIYLKNRTRSY